MAHAKHPISSTVTSLRIGPICCGWLISRTFRTWVGFLYLAVVLDVFSRRIVGWSMATTLHTQLVLDALKMVLWQRRPNSVIHHSDQGSQYTSIEFGKRCRQAGVRPSMGSVGDAYDNAMAESFFATLECELLDRRRFKTHAEARMAVFEFIEGFYNPRHRHSSLGYLSPIIFERHFAAVTLEPGAHQHAVVLAPVKERPGNIAANRAAGVPAVLDSRSTRRRRKCAGRDGKMLTAKPKDYPKRRTECGQTRYPDPKTSPVHETGASPAHHLERWASRLGQAQRCRCGLSVSLPNLGGVARQGYWLPKAPESDDFQLREKMMNTGLRLILLWIKLCTKRQVHQSVTKVSLDFGPLFRHRRNIPIEEYPGPVRRCRL